MSNTMSEHRYTAQEMRERANDIDPRVNEKESKTLLRVLTDGSNVLGSTRVSDTDSIELASNMLRYAAGVVERCEKLIRTCNLEDAPCVPSDDGYCDSCDVPKHNEPFNYILRGDAGKEER